MRKNSVENSQKKGWVTDFIDEFNFFDEKNSQDQLIWVNEENQCHLRDGNSISVKFSNGTLKLRLFSLNYEKQ